VLCNESLPKGPLTKVWRNYGAAPICATHKIVWLVKETVIALLPNVKIAIPCYPTLKTSHNRCPDTFQRRGFRPPSSIVLNLFKKRRKSRKTNSRNLSPSLLNLGANRVDFFDEEASIKSNSSSMLENIIGQESTELKQSVLINGGSQQWTLKQKGVPGFDSTSIPLNYVCFPLDKFLNLFNRFKCHQCKSRH
jgi:hypothetical protein